MKKSIVPAPIDSTPCFVGESPHWDEATQALYWVDIYGQAVFKYQPNTHQVQRFDLPEMVGHVIPLSAKEALISMPSGIYKLALETQALQRLSELEPQHPNNRPNDGKCDPQGRLWVGTIDMEFKKGASSLYRLEHNGDLTQVLTGLTLANGLAWDVNKNLFYFIDSDTACVQRFDYHPETGDITNRAVAFQYDKALGLPDGMCIDPEGMLWVAGFNGGQVSRFNPNTGKILQTIKLPTPYITSCALGGKDLNQLFITSASHLLTAEDKKLDKQSGLTFSVELF